jgi:hypothetical protein
MQSLSDDVTQIRAVYDSVDPDQIDTQLQRCSIGMNYNADQNCTLEFRAPKEMKPPILIYYELDNFHQNHRSYSMSRNDFQLTGGDASLAAVDECKPLTKLGNQNLNPCGKIANTFFNDVFYLETGQDEDGEPLVMVEEGIAWQSDIQYRFAQPDGFMMKECDANQCNNVSATCCQENEFSCDIPVISKKDEKCYAYNYPEEETTRYLYETYPQISPLDGVTDEHFIVWMRVATRPRFRKLYGYLEQTIPEGTIFSITINSNYVVESFGGYKAIIISTTNIFGGQNPNLGVTFYAAGFFCLGCGLLFAAKHWFRPRKIADRKYLHYKED